MKKLLIAVLMIGALSFKFADAQISFKLNLNIGSQPDWGPTGYDHVDYYYMPDIGCYYDVAARQYVYLNGRNWTRSASLPPRYGNYDLYHGYKVVVNQPKPYLHDNVYRTKYASYRGHAGQPVIRDSREEKYRRPQNNNNQGRDNRGGDNRGRGNDRGNGRPGDHHQ